MLKNLCLLLFVSLFLLGCAGVPVEKLNKLEPEISKEELVEQWGEPRATHYIEGQRVLEYFVDVGYFYWLVFDKEDKLIGWSEKPSDKKHFSGFILNVPMPQ